MKRNLFTLALLLNCATCFAQTKLVDEFPTMMKARNADPVGYFKAHTTPDMTFIAGHDGAVHNKDWLLNLLNGQKSQQADITNLKIQQSGDMAVATGISTITAVMTDGKNQSYKDAFTYTLRWLDGQWLLTNMHHTKMDYR